MSILILFEVTRFFRFFNNVLLSKKSILFYSIIWCIILNYLVIWFGYIKCSSDNISDQPFSEIPLFRECLIGWPLGYHGPFDDIKRVYIPVDLIFWIFIVWLALNLIRYFKTKKINNHNLKM